MTQPPCFPQKFYGMDTHTTIQKRCKPNEERNPCENENNEGEVEASLVISDGKRRT